MTDEYFEKLLSRHNRIAIVGGPQTGKTTLASKVTDRPVHFNDQGRHLEWADQPDFWMRRTQGQKKFIIEGVHAIRAVRKGLPVDAIIHLTQPFKELTPGQASMHKGQQSMVNDVKKNHPHIIIYS